MRITEAVNSIVDAHPEMTRTSIKRSFNKELQLGYTIQQTKARVEQTIYRERVAAHLIRPEQRTTAQINDTNLPAERKYRLGAVILDRADPTGALASHNADCRSEACRKCESQEEA